MVVVLDGGGVHIGGREGVSVSVRVDVRVSIRVGVSVRSVTAITATNLGWCQRSPVEHSTNQGH